jgi:hypothetical protein
MRIRRVSVAALLAVLSAPAAAQQPVPAESLAAVRARAVAALHPRERVRLSLGDGGLVDGRFLSAIVDSLRLANGVGPRTVPLAAVDGLWTRGRHTTLGAVVGGTVIGASNGYLFYVLGAMLCGIGGSENCHPWGFAVLGALGGAAGGALLGGAIGAAFTGWSRRFP